jgi:DNA-binding transcriptional LysR family regulator
MQYTCGYRMFESLLATSGLSYERLHALILLGDSGSLIKAAKGDSGLQSRLSHRLRELSEFIGTELTAKDGKSIKLSPPGERLAEIAREHFMAIQGFRDRAMGFATTFRIGAGDDLSRWIVVPAIGKLRRRGGPLRVTVGSFRTRDIVEQLKDRRLEFGVLRGDAIDISLKHARICEQRYAIFVPLRLAHSRGFLSVQDALLKCPHAALGGEGQLLDRLRILGKKLGGIFEPELMCSSIGQCIAAVGSGSFAAVLPVPVLATSGVQDYLVVEDETLEDLSRQIVLAWHPRMVEVLGQPARKMQQTFTDELRESAKIGSFS